MEHVRLQGSVSTHTELATWETSQHHANHQKEATTIEQRHAPTREMANAGTEATNVTESTSRRSIEPSGKEPPPSVGWREKNEQAKRAATPRSEAAKNMDKEKQKSIEEATAKGSSDSNLGNERRQRKER